MLKDILNALPEAKKVAVILSGGMDSTIATRIAVEKYGKENVYALSFDYGQRQRYELEQAKKSTTLMSIDHHIIDLSCLCAISQGFSANVDRSISMPTIKEVLGDPTPITYVPNRNMIMLSIAAAFAETRECSFIFCGIQSRDEYGYYDATSEFVDQINNVFSMNRKNKIKVLAPFSHMSKADEMNVLKELDGNLNLLKHTLTCYDPDDQNRSCGKCPSCAERIMNFMKIGEVDPVPYSIDIPWKK